MTPDTDRGGPHEHRTSQQSGRREGSRLGPDNEMWTSRSSSPQEAAKVLNRHSGTWVASKKKALAKLCDVDNLLSGFAVEDADRSKIDVATVEDIGGVDAVPLSGWDGKKRGTVWIAVDAPHRVVKLTQQARNELPRSALLRGVRGRRGVRVAGQEGRRPGPRNLIGARAG